MDSIPSYPNEKLVAHSIANKNVPDILARFDSRIPSSSVLLFPRLSIEETLASFRTRRSSGGSRGRSSRGMQRGTIGWNERGHPAQRRTGTLGWSRGRSRTFGRSKTHAGHPGGKTRRIQRWEQRWSIGGCFRLRTFHPLATLSSIELTLSILQIEGIKAEVEDAGEFSFSSLVPSQILETNTNKRANRMET